MAEREEGKKVAQASAEEVARIEQYHDRYPSSLAFGDVYEPRSFKQRLAELELEHLLQDCDDLSVRRQKRYSDTAGQRNLILPKGQELPDPRRLRADRDAVLETLAYVDDPEPLVIQGDVLKSELDWATKPRFDVSTAARAVYVFLKQYREQLVQKKYGHLLRWARFCRKTDSMEQDRGAFMRRLEEIEDEYARVQAAITRIAPSQREVFETKVRKKPQTDLAGDDGAAEARPVTPPSPVGEVPMPGAEAPPPVLPECVDEADVALFLRWNVHRYKATNKVHRFFKKLEWLSHSKRSTLFVRTKQLMRASALGAIERHQFEDNIHIVNNNTLPLMVHQRAHLDSVLTELREYWALSTDIQVDDGQEFLYYTNKKFQKVFCEQIAASFFPGYASTVRNLAQEHLEAMIDIDKVTTSKPKLEELRKITAQTVHLKEAKWLPFVAYQASVDMDAVRQNAALHQVDETNQLLTAECGFLASQDVEESMKRLRRLMEDHQKRSASVTALDSDEIKASLARYDQDYRLQPSDPLPDDTDHDSPQYLSPSKLLSVYLLRHIRTRDFRRRLQHVLNFFRSLERRLTIDAHAFAFEKKPPGDGAGVDGEASAVDVSLGASPSRGSPVSRAASTTHMSAVQSTARLSNPGVMDLPQRGATDVMSFKGIENRDDTYDVADNKDIRVRDSNNVYVLYDVAVDDMERLEKELVDIGSHFVAKDARARFDATSDERAQRKSVDLQAVLADLFESELWFQDTKRQVLECYVEIYEHTVNPEDHSVLAQLITDTIAMRPRVDLEAPYFTESYASDIACMELQLKLLRDMISSSIADERLYSRFAQGRNDTKPRQDKDGLPDAIVAQHIVQLTTVATPVYMMEFHPHLAAIARLPSLVTYCLNEMVQSLQPMSRLCASTLHHILLKQLMVEWRLLLEEDRARVKLVDDPLHATTLMEDSSSVEAVVQEFSTEVLERESVDSQRQRLAARYKKEGQASTLVRFSKSDLGAASPFSVATLLVHAVEVVRLRAELLNALFESEVLSGVYQNQARLMGHDLHKNTIKPLVFDRHGEEIEDDVTDPVEVTSAATDQVLNLAIAEFDIQMADFDFHTPTGLKRLLQPSGVDLLRRALQVQVVHKNMLLVAVHYNSVTLDPAQWAHLQRADRMEEEAFQAKLAHARGDESAPPELAPAKADENRRRRQAELTRIRLDELSKTTPYFLNVNVRKITLRHNIISVYIEKYAKILRTSKPDFIPSKTKELKLELVSGFCQDMMSDLYVFSARAQAARVLEELRRRVEQIPDVPDADAFKLAPDPTTVPPRPQLGDRPEDTDQFFATDGSGVANLWTIPHPKYILQALKDEPTAVRMRALCCALHIFHSFHGIVNVAAFFSRLQLPPFEYHHPELGLARVPEILHAIKTESHALGDRSNFSSAARFLADKKAKMFVEVLLACRNGMELFVERQNILAFAHVRDYLRSIVPRSLPHNVYADTLDFLLLVDKPVMFEPLVPEEPDPTEQDDAAEAFARNYRNRVGPALHLTEGPFIGAWAPHVYSALPLFMADLHETDRQYIGKEISAVSSLMDDLMAENHVYPTSQPQEAVEQQLGFLRKSIVLMNLKEDYLNRALNISSLLTQHADHERKAALYHAEIVPKLLLRCRTSGYWQQKHDLEIGASNGEYIPTLDELRSILPEKVLRDFQIRLLTEEIDDQLISRQREALMAVQASLVNELDTRGVRSEEDRRAVSEQDYATKLSFFREFVTSILESGFEGPPGRLDERTVCLEQKALNSALDVMAQKLYSWNEERLANRLQSLTLLNQHVTHLLHLAESERDHLTNMRRVEQKATRRIIQTEVADKGYELILELSTLYRQLAKVKETMDSQAIQIREHVKQEYDDLVHDLYTQYISTRSNFEEYRQFLYQEMQREIHAVKQESTKKLLDFQRLPLEVKKRTQQLAEQEETVFQLKETIITCEKTILKLKTMHTMKEVALRQNFEKKIREEKKDRVTKTKKLFEIRESMEQAKELLMQQFTFAQRALGSAEEQVKQLRRDLEQQQKNKQQLVHWKVAKSHLLDQLQEKVKKYERWKQIDVDKLLVELEAKDEELQQLQVMRDRQEKHANVSDKKQHRELHKLQSQLQHEMMLKHEAFAEIDGLRSVIYQQQNNTRSVSSAGSADSMSAQWKRKYDVLLEEMQMIRQENDMMRRSLSQLGHEPPSADPSPVSGPYISSMTTRPLSAPGVERAARPPRDGRSSVKSGRDSAVSSTSPQPRESLSKKRSLRAL